MTTNQRLTVAASLLWSWLCEARRQWATEPDCLLALQTFRLTDPERRLTPEEAQAAFTVAVLTNLVAVDDEWARIHYRSSMGRDPLPDEVIVRARAQSRP